MLVWDDDETARRKLLDCITNGVGRAAGALHEKPQSIYRHIFVASFSGGTPRTLPSMAFPTL